MDKFKRGFAGLLAIFLACGTVKQLDVYAQAIINECNYNDGKAVVTVLQPEGYPASDLIAETGDEHEKALRVRKQVDSKGEPTDEVLRWYGLPALEGDYSSLSFEIMPLRDDLEMSVSIISKNDEGGDGRSILLSFNKNGKIGCGEGWTIVDASSANKIGTYKKGEWLKFRVIFDKIDQKMTVFLNDEKVKEITVDTLANFKDFHQIDYVRFYNLKSVGNAGTELCYLDNVKWITGAKKGEMSAAVKSFDEKNKEITVAFTENPVSFDFASETELLCCNESAEQTSVSLTAKLCGVDYVVFGYEEQLSPACEYAVVFPSGVSGEDGGVLSQRYLYYTTEAEAESTLVQECDYDDGKVTVTALIPSGYEDRLLADTNDDHIKAFRLLKELNSADEARKWHNLVIPSSNMLSLSFDVMPKRNDLNTSVSLVGGSDAKQTEPVTVTFLSNGKIMCGNSWTLLSESSGDLIGTYQSGTWINFKFVHDKQSGTMKVYLNGDLAKTFTKSELSEKKFENIGFVRFFVSKSMGNTGNELLWLDNIKTESIEKSVSVDKVRFCGIEQNEAGPFDTVSRRLESISLSFSDKVDESTLNEENITLEYNGNEVGVSVEPSNGNYCLVVPETLPPKGAEIRIKTKNIKDINKKAVKNFSSYAVADLLSDEFTIYSPSLLDEDGKTAGLSSDGTLTLKTAIINTLSETKKVFISLSRLEDGAMSGLSYEIVTVNPNEMYVVDFGKNEMSIDTANADSVVCGFSDAVSGLPLCSPVRLDFSDNGEKTEFVFEDQEDALKGGALVNAEVFASGKTVSDLSSASDYKEVLVYKNQINADKDGNLSISFNIEDNSSGMYTLRMYGSRYSFEKTFLYTNPTKAQEVFDSKLKQPLSQGETDAVGTVLLENRYDLFADDRYLSDETKEKAAALLVKYAEENGTSAIDLDTLKKIVNKAIAVSAFENGDITDIIKEAEIFDLENSDIKELYKKSFVDEDTVADITERLSGKTYSSFGDFDKSLNDAFILAVVKNSSEPNSVKTVLNKFGIYGKTAKHYDYVAETDYETVEDLKNAISSYNPPGGGSSGGGGGGGNSIIKIEPEQKTEIDDENKTEEITETMVFGDLYGFEWAKEAILSLAEKNIVNGKEAGRFCPNDKITREEFTKILVNALGLKGGDDFESFIDVDNQMWYAPYIQKASNAKIVSGISEGVFGVGQNITRQGMAVMIYRAISDKGYFGGAESKIFADDASISDYAREAVYALYDAGILSGTDSNCFCPLSDATRAEAAKMIFGIIGG